MPYGPKQVFTGGVIASAASTGTFIDFGEKTFTKMAVKFPSMSTAAMLTLFGCDTSGGTYAPVLERVNTAPVQHQTMTIATSTSGAWVQFDMPPLRYLKFAASATVTDGSGAFTIVVQD